MASATDVTVAEVRTALGTLDGVAGLSDASIQAEIDDAVVKVTGSATEGATGDQLHLAVKSVAAYRVLRKNRETFVERASELDLTEEMNVDAIIESYEEDRDDALQQVRRGAGFFRAY